MLFQLPFNLLCHFCFNSIIHGDYRKKPMSVFKQISLNPLLQISWILPYLIPDLSHQGKGLEHFRRILAIDPAFIYTGEVYSVPFRKAVADLLDPEFHTSQARLHQGGVKTFLHYGGQGRKDEFFSFFSLLCLGSGEAYREGKIPVCVTHSAFAGDISSDSAFRNPSVERASRIT